MGSFVDWSELERAGKIPASPGREQAVKDAAERSAKKKLTKQPPKAKK
jgi:hypothetical protein